MPKNSVSTPEVDADATATMIQTVLDSTDAVVVAADAAAKGDLAPYLAGDRSTRAKVRNLIDVTMKANLDKGDLPTAMLFLAADKAIRALAGTAAPKAETDWHLVTQDRINVLRHAADLLEQGTVRIDGTPDGFEYVQPTALVDAEAEWSVPAQGKLDVEAATALATRKATRSGPTHNVAEAVRAAFADLNDGDFLSIADIGRHWVAAGGPTGNSGRIAARLFADVCTIEGVTPVASTATAPRGAKKVGDWS